MDLENNGSICNTARTMAKCMIGVMTNLPMNVNSKNRICFSAPSKFKINPKLNMIRGLEILPTISDMEITMCHMGFHEAGVSGTIKRNENPMRKPISGGENIFLISPPFRFIVGYMTVRNIVVCVMLYATAYVNADIPRRLSTIG